MIITEPSTKEWAEQIAFHINKDYPNSARVNMNASGYYVAVTKKYYEYCINYVLGNCKIKK